MISQFQNKSFGTIFCIFIFWWTYGWHGKICTKYFTNPYKGHNSTVFYNMYYTTIIMHATLNSFLLIICQFWCSHLFAEEEGEVTLPIIHIFIHNCYPSRNSAAVMTQPRVTTHIHAYNPGSTYRHVLY